MDGRVSFVATAFFPAAMAPALTVPPVIEMPKFVDMMRQPLSAAVRTFATADLAFAPAPAAMLSAVTVPLGDIHALVEYGRLPLDQLAGIDTLGIKESRDRLQQSLLNDLRVELLVQLSKVAVVSRIADHFTGAARSAVVES